MHDPIHSKANKQSLTPLHHYTLHPRLAISAGLGTFGPVERFDLGNMHGVTIDRPLGDVIRFCRQGDHHLGLGDEHHLRMEDVVGLSIGQVDPKPLERALALQLKKLFRDHNLVIIARSRMAVKAARRPRYNTALIDRSSKRPPDLNL